jgi:hypothetical protein
MILVLCFGVALVAVLAVVFHRETRQAHHGLTLSNGLDVLVSPSEYEEILLRFERLRSSPTGLELDDEQRWDDAILGVIRANRPMEWRFLARSLNAAEPMVLRQRGRAFQQTGL